MKVADRILRLLDEGKSLDKDVAFDLLYEYGVGKHANTNFLFSVSELASAIRKTKMKEETLRSVLENSQFAINTFWSKGYPLYRGMNGSMFQEKMVRTDRVPRDIPVLFHDFLSKEFKKKFGFTGRGDCLFVSCDKGSTFIYGGGVFAIFPVGKFDWIYCKEHTDLMGSLEQIVTEITGKNIYLDSHTNVGKNGGATLLKMMDDDPLLLGRIQDKLRKIVSSYKKNVVGKDLLNYDENDYGPPEIMLHCKKYYAIKVDEGR